MLLSCSSHFTFYLTCVNQKSHHELVHPSMAGESHCGQQKHQEQTTCKLGHQIFIGAQVSFQRAMKEEDFDLTPPDATATGNPGNPEESLEPWMEIIEVWIWWIPENYLGIQEASEVYCFIRAHPWGNTNAPELRTTILTRFWSVMIRFHFDFVLDHRKWF